MATKKPTTLVVGTVDDAEDEFENAEFTFETQVGVAGVMVYRALGGEKQLRAYYPIGQVRYVKVDEES